MQIHVVKSGDTLWNLSRIYKVSTQAIIEANGLTDPNYLVRGQALVIPVTGQYHIVKSGETLYKIAQQYGISIQTLVQMNNIKNPNNIPLGFRLILPTKSKPSIYTGSYIDPKMTGTRSAKLVEKVGKDLTYLNLFSYQVQRDGDLTSLDDGSILNAARQNKVAPLLVLTNLENGQFKTDLATILFTNEQLQDRVLDQALEIMQLKGYRGLDVDFEYLGAENRELYVRFLEKAARRIKPLGYSLSVAVAPKISGEQSGVLYEGHDYQGIGKIVDFMFIMTYEWGWSGGKPMAVAPLNQVRRVISYAVSVVPREKIMMGIPLYGYDWTLPYTPGKWAKSISPQRALELAQTYNVSIQYDTGVQAPWFRYHDEKGNEHEVWFEDARSIAEKFNLVKEFKLRGFYYWVLGHEFPQNWLLIEDNFVVKKIV
ncbi:glycoside hydrolase family 18 protein [Desulfitobacterium sp.]|uniref:glycoside hydrolase family 18 protein n=1 Tax=Desulfitobacterium sp. TaxID=49981 RepID=UPI002B1EC950|nr:glycoside hydrolase family 18 protein [Desulfitobacterium sp.]MEA4903038.1 glycoside hydrolase family 18 protein [Desulfitobacterium sp.]